MTTESETLLGQSEDDLLERFGKELASGGLSQRGGGPGDWRQRARNWFERHWDDLRRIAREDAVVQAAQTENAALLMRLAGLIGDRLLGTEGALTAAAIIVKLGLNTLRDSPEPPWR